MKRWCPLLLLPVILAAKPMLSEDIDALIRAGNDALKQNNPALAIAFYEKAQRRTTDPGLVAFNLATARYAQALAGNQAALAQAETAYRCCLDHEARRAKAYFGLGNCQLLRGSVGKLDAHHLRAAIDRYTQALRDANCDEHLAHDAKHNQQRARLLLLQAPPPTYEQNDEREGDEKDPEEQPRDKKKEPAKQKEPSNDPVEDDGKGNREEKDKPGDKAAKPSPGKGSMSPVPEDANAAPIASAEANDRLDRALRAILADNMRHRQSRPRPTTNVRDW